MKEKIGKCALKVSTIYIGTWKDKVGSDLKSTGK